MAAKLSTQGLLIYLTMLGYLLAFAFLACKRRRTGLALYGCGFALAMASFVFRWAYVRHWPLQNLFEVFLSLGMLMFPLSVLCRRFLSVGGEAADALIGFAMLWPAGFVLSDAPQDLPPALQSPFFVPHVAAYLSAYAIMAKATVQAAAQLIMRQEHAAQAPAISREEATYRMVRLGFPLMTAGLLLGAWWGKLAWGDYWNWDPKELWSLAAWLIYVSFLHFRAMHGARHAKANAVLAVAGMAAIVITLLWVNLASVFAGLHSYAN